ncbi:hypothetical protein GLOIN_2v1765706 [Rhizophagus irregularis DAOM 181602=DAOM 197198]|nr:hypothetical protein GLOIN_2v1765706 [Rhizophagus irregularis DAOM 181602=DAOM 197198]
MSDTINLNYLIVPRGQTVNALEAVIQNNLGASFNYIPLDIRQIHPGSVDERRMQSQVLISDYFNGDPPADYFHIVDCLGFFSFFRLFQFVASESSFFVGQTFWSSLSFF